MATGAAPIQSTIFLLTLRSRVRQERATYQQVHAIHRLIRPIRSRSRSRWPAGATPASDGKQGSTKQCKWPRPRLLLASKQLSLWPEDKHAEVARALGVLARRSASGKHQSFDSSERKKTSSRMIGTAGPLCARDGGSGQMRWKAEGGQKIEGRAREAGSAEEVGADV